ncbi:hypothetical protein HMSSN036_41890 [Paenibacillus macerans]|nr:hypothetical protein HMSSN036_41890 [Paenibacillus macerans]
MAAIEVRDLRKTFKVQKNREGLKGAFLDLFKREYNEVAAVKDISFQIPEGEICGYIGENGAGEVDDDQNADRHFGADFGTFEGRGLCAL